MAVGIGAVTTGSMGGIGVGLTVSFTSTTEPLYVVLPVWLNTGVTISGITYNAVALTRVAQATASSGGDRAEIWRLLAPASGAHNLVVTNSSGNTADHAGTIAIFNTTGQDAAGTPEGTAATNSSSTTGTSTGSLSIAGMASGDLVIACISNGAGAAITPSNTGGTGLTEFYDTGVGGEESEGFRVSDACTAVSGSWTGATSWAIAAIPLKMVAAADPFPSGRVRPGLTSTVRRAT